MDDGFKDRVDKVFGSSSSWSLTGAPVERRQWNRDDDDDDRVPVVSSFQAETLNDDIRSSIGLDPTLDNEEEEDAYDKMAQGTDENCTSDRLYMKDHGPYLNSHNALLTSLRQTETRLKGDDDDEPMLNAQASESEDATIKSILKRKTYDELPKPAKAPKRVRFHSTCKNVDAAHPYPTQVPEYTRALPDYILNPSKYIRYTFDEPSHHTSNTESSYLEFSEQASKLGGELPKSVVFIPRKKIDDGYNSVKQSSTQACSTIAIGIAAFEGQQGEIDETQDDVCTKGKPVRRYRSKIQDEYDDDVS